MKKIKQYILLITLFSPIISTAQIRVSDPSNIAFTENSEGTPIPSPSFSKGKAPFIPGDTGATTMTPLPGFNPGENEKEPPKGTVSAKEVLTDSEYKSVPAEKILTPEQLEGIKNRLEARRGPIFLQTPPEPPIINRGTISLWNTQTIEEFSSQGQKNLESRYSEFLNSK